MSPCRCPMQTSSMTCAATSKWCAIGWPLPIKTPLHAVRARAEKCLKRPSAHPARQIEGDDRKADQDREADEVGNHERNYAQEYGRETHVLHHALDDKDVHADRRMDQPEFDRHDDDDAE